MRKAEEILDDIMAGGVGTTEEVRAEAIAVIEQAQREAIEEAADLCREMSDNSPPFIANVIEEKLLPHREGE